MVQNCRFFYIRYFSKDIFWMETIQVNLCQKLFFLQNMGRKCCVQKLFWMSKTISFHNMFSPYSELVGFMYWSFNPIPIGHGRNQPIYERHVTKSGRNRVNSMNNLSSYCGLVDAKIRDSDKDLPVHGQHCIFCNTFFVSSWYREKLLQRLAVQRTST
jgi:hypothetical protein